MLAYTFIWITAIILTASAHRRHYEHVDDFFALPIALYMQTQGARPPTINFQSQPQTVQTFQPASGGVSQLTGPINVSQNSNTGAALQPAINLPAEGGGSQLTGPINVSPNSNTGAPRQPAVSLPAESGSNQLMSPINSNPAVVALQPTDGSNGQSISATNLGTNSNKQPALNLQPGISIGPTNQIQQNIRPNNGGGAATRGPPIISSTTQFPFTTTAPPAFQRCVQNCPVTSQYSPVCGTNRFTYNNISRLRCAQFCGLVVDVSNIGRCP